MARKKSSPFEDLIEIAAKLPWKAAVGLAIVAYLGFHFVATLPPTSFVAADMKAYAQTAGQGVVRQMLITFSAILQYVVTIGFLIGAAASFVRQRRQSELHLHVAQSPGRNALENISWQEFEGLTAEVFRRKGFQVIERGGNGPDGGVDLELRAGSDKYLVQCKQWKVTKVGVATVRELYGVMTAERAVGGFVVSSGDFTDDARRFAEGRSIELVSSETMVRLVQETGGSVSPAPTRPTAETQPTCPKCGSVMVRRRARQGTNAGNSFWGCSKYPACRGIVN